MPVKSPRFAMFDLAEGKSYSFRVRCCNSAGVGEASVSTGEITVGDILGEFRSDVLYYFSFQRSASPDASVCPLLRYTLYPRQSCGHQEHEHISGGHLGSLKGRQTPGRLLH